MGLTLCRKDSSRMLNLTNHGSNIVRFVGCGSKRGDERYIINCSLN